MRNMSEHVASSAEDLLRLMTTAKDKRLTAMMERNAASSRSHGIGILRPAQTETEAGYQDLQPTEGVLYVVDLAGSERAADQTEHTAARMKESADINTSLLSLKECIRARTLASKPGLGATHVPYHRAKLTLLMKDIFDPACPRLCNTVVVARVSSGSGCQALPGHHPVYAAPCEWSMRTAKHPCKEMKRIQPCGPTNRCPHCWNQLCCRKRSSQNW